MTQTTCAVCNRDRVRNRASATFCRTVSVRPHAMVICARAGGHPRLIEAASLDKAEMTPHAARPVQRPIVRHALTMRIHALNAKDGLRQMAICASLAPIQICRHVLNATAITGAGNIARLASMQTSHHALNALAIIGTGKVASSGQNTRSSLSGVAGCPVLEFWR